ncbi:MAG: hypothetical protein ACF8K1_05335 [Phycisphaerales bacterium JB047]
MISLFVLAQAASTAISWTKIVSLAWPIVAALGGVFASIWATSKVTETKLETIQREIRELERENREQRDRLVSAEKEIANTLKSIEVKLSELSATVSLFMQYQETKGKE